jgi:uncharacterized membrane protein YphA (DoxX/SURF4 family)
MRHGGCRERGNTLEFPPLPLASRILNSQRIMIDSRRYLSRFGILALVFLRLVIGWHFFGEGMKKVEFNWQEKRFRQSPTQDEDTIRFLNQAKGPLTPWYRAHMPGEHGWQALLAAPRQNVPPTAEDSEKLAKWITDYERRRDEAKKKGEAPPVEFPASAAYYDWARRIADDWRETLAKVKAVAGLSDDQNKKADAIYQSHREDLARYMAGEEDAIAEYRHELWRLNHWREAPESGDVPFYQKRISTKATESATSVAHWVKDVAALDAGYHSDLNGLLTSEQRNNGVTALQWEGALADPGQHRLDFINHVVTWVTIGVGVCLLLGFFTRLASLAGALFLFSVIASQPFWLTDAAPTINQCVELAGLLVLAGTGPGRWLGLDYFTYAMMRRWRD